MHNASFWQAPGVTKTDLARALPSIMLARAGYDTAMHPLAEEISERCNLASLAAWLADRSFSPHDGPDILKSFRAGVGSIQFGDALEKTGREIIRQSFGRKAHIGLVARSLPQRDFKDFDRTMLGVSGLDEKGQPENDEAPMIFGTAHTIKTGKLYNFMEAILVQERDLINDDMELISRLFETAGQIAHAREWRVLIDAFDTNPTVPELDAPTGTARPYFGADDKNLLASPGAPTTTALNSALALLRRQPGGDGRPMGLGPRILLVPPEVEMTARKILHDHQMPEVTTVVAPHLADAYYLLADPQAYAALGVSFVGLAGSPIVTTNLHKVQKLGSMYGGRGAAGFQLQQSFRPQLLSRRGIVRCPLT